MSLGTRTHTHTQEYHTHTHTQRIKNDTHVMHSFKRRITAGAWKIHFTLVIACKKDTMQALNKLL